MVLGIFKVALCLRDRHVFMWQSVQILNVFNTLTLKQTFWKTKTFFKKMECRFLVENTKIENVSFPYKTTILETNVKANTAVNTKWTNRKERSFASNYFFFKKNCFNLRTSYKELIWCTNNQNAYIRIFCKRWSFIWRYIFPVSILKEVMQCGQLFCYTYLIIVKNASLA